MKKFVNESIESIRIALEQVNEHRLRSLLTALGVIIGVIAVTLMGTAIKGIDIGFNNSLNMLGTDMFYIERWPWSDVGDNWIKYRNRPHLKAEYAEQLNEIIGETENSLLRIAVPTVWSPQTIKRDDRDLSDVNTFGTTADYPLLDNADILYGRFLTDTECVSGRNATVIGYDVAEALFPEGIEQAVDKEIRIGRRKFTVVGVYDKQGSFLGIQSFDKNLVMPLPTLRKFFINRWWDTTSIRVKAIEDADMDEAKDELIGAMRRIRTLEPGEENDFEINQSDLIEEQLGPVKGIMAIAGLFITGLSLFVGAIGIMNITFVSVKERTKEIGTRRAIGARRRSILLQFLTESSMICLMGGMVGLGLSYLFKLLFKAMAPNFPLVMSAEIIILAVGVSILTGIVSGFAPAFQASQLDPAEALRHE